MNTESAYQFLKPALEQLSEKEKKELIALIQGEPAKEPKRAKKKDHILSKVEMKKRLLKSHFKSKSHY